MSVAGRHAEDQAAGLNLTLFSGEERMWQPDTGECVSVCSAAREEEVVFSVLRSPSADTCHFVARTSRRTPFKKASIKTSRA